LWHHRADERPLRLGRPHPLLAKYNDAEWGVPAHDDRQLFELLNLEGRAGGLTAHGVRSATPTAAAFDRCAKKIVRYTAPGAPRC